MRILSVDIHKVWVLEVTQNVRITFDTRNSGKLRKTFCVVSTELLGIRDGAVMRSLASQQCDLGFDSDPVPPAIWWLSLLLVVVSLRFFFQPGERT